MTKHDDHKELRKLCNLVRLCRLLQMSDTETAREIIKKYGFYITQLTYDEYVTWIRSDRKFAKIYFEVVAKEIHKGCEDILNK